MENIKLVISDEIHEIEIREFRGQRVLTLRDIDMLHKRTVGTSSRNFQNNRKYFIEDEDCFVVQPSQNNEFRCLGIPNRGLTLLTESGYLMLVKSFTDKLAWEVQRQLVKTYFKAKAAFTPTVEIVQVPQTPTTIEDILLMAIGSMKDMKKEISHLSLVVDNEVHLTDHQLAEVQEAVKHRVGELSKQGYEKHFQSIYSALKVFFTVPKYNKIKRGDFEKAMDFINGWYPKKDETAN